MTTESLQEISLKIGHVLIKVSDLRAAKSDFEQMGFTVTLPSDPKKSVNAMVYLRDDSFIELYCMNMSPAKMVVAKAALGIITKMGVPSAGRYRKYLAGPEGFSDYALDSNGDAAFAHNLEMLKQNGLPVHGPQKKWHVDTEGVRRTWSIYHPGDARFPFYMSPFSPPRIPTEAMTTHVNGAIGISELWFYAKDWEYSYGFYQKLLGQVPQVAEDGEARQSCFSLGRTSLFLTEGSTDCIRKLVLSCEKPGKKRLDCGHLLGRAELWLHTKAN